MIPDELFGALCSGARGAFWEAHNHARHHSGGRPPDEVDHIFALTSYGITVLGNAWKPLLRSRGIALRVSGVFCHQTPKAHYHHPSLGSKSPEIADLLIVHEHQHIGPGGVAEVSRKALLVQAKMVTNGRTQGGKVDADQEYLYEHWPDFELVGRGSDGRRFLPGRRCIGPDAVGARYGLIEKDSDELYYHYYRSGFWGVGPWTFAPPGAPVRTAGGEDAGAFVANMLYQTVIQRGRTASRPSPPLLLDEASPNNHFDVTVQELLEITAAKILAYRSKRQVQGPRGRGFEACWQVEDGPLGLLSGIGDAFTPLVSVLGGDGGRVVRGEEESPDDGISVILVETGAEGASPER